MYKYPDVNASEPTDEGEPAVAGASGGTDHSSPASLPAARAAVADRLADYGTLLEVGIGRRPAVAARLAADGQAVTAIDIHNRPVPEGVTFLRRDLFDWADRLAGSGARIDADPQLEILLGGETDAIYGLNLPPELHTPALTIAEAAGAALLFTTLGGDPPAVPVEREALDSGTLYVARE